MRAEWINPFVTSTQDVFTTMLSFELIRGPLSVKKDPQPELEISGVIGLTGRAAGVVVVSLSRGVALHAAETMLGSRHEEVDADVIDAVGELANMIAGGAKRQLEELDMSVSLPSVICGTNHRVQFPSHTTPIAIPFEAESGPICISVGLSEVTK